MLSPDWLIIPLHKITSKFVFCSPPAGKPVKPGFCSAIHNFSSEGPLPRAAFPFSPLKVFSYIEHARTVLFWISEGSRKGKGVGELIPHISSIPIVIPTGIQILKRYIF